MAPAVDDAAGHALRAFGGRRGRSGQSAFVFGGHNGSLDFTPGREASVYDPALGTWDQLRPLPTNRVNAAAAMVSSSTAMVIGGSWDPFWLGGSAFASVEQIKFGGCDVYEPDHTVALANPIRWLESQSGFPLDSVSMTHARVCTASDVDLYAITSFNWTGGDLKLRLFPPPGRDYQLELLDASGTTVLARSAIPGNATESITCPFTNGVDYVARVRSQNGSFDATRTYELNSYQ